MVRKYTVRKRVKGGFKNGTVVPNPLVTTVPTPSTTVVNPFRSTQLPSARRGHLNIHSTLQEANEASRRPGALRTGHSSVPNPLSISRSGGRRYRKKNNKTRRRN